MAHKLENYPLHYEKNKKDVVKAKLMRKFRSFKLKPIRRGWVAQVRPNIDGQRVELAEIAPSPEKAVELLDKRVESRGLYE